MQRRIYLRAFFVEHLAPYSGLLFSVPPRFPR
jgi:hypothetical protein